jgi:signal transduction histidine kinase
MKASGEIDGMKCSFVSEDIIELSADRHLMEQLFINLFTNARDAMEAQGLLKIEVHPLDNDVRIIVSDAGKGIPASDIPRIFDPFFTTKDRGTGLGLAIVYSIIKKHNGKIKVKSEEGRGTTFIIDLPKGI